MNCVHIEYCNLSETLHTSLSPISVPNGKYLSFLFTMCPVVGDGQCIRFQFIIHDVYYNLIIQFCVWYARDGSEGKWNFFSTLTRPTDRQVKQN